MTFDYQRAYLTAHRLIASFGQAVTLRQAGPTTGPEYDPMPGAAVDHVVRAVDLSKIVRNMDGVETGHVVRTLYMQASVSPAKGDTVRIGAEWCEITAVKPLSPAGVTVLFELELRA